MPTAQRIADLVQAYAEGPGLLQAAVAGIPEDELHFKPGPEHWSIHENVVHVADTDLVAATRIRYVLAQPGSTLVAFDQNLWARTLDYAAHPLDEALALLRAIRATTTELLRRAPASAWEQTGMHTEDGPQTLEWIVNHFADHIHYHLRTIAKRRRQYAERRGLPQGHR
ncbi:MAG: DinB family protein [Armatimonadota bacterium]|nr:DinB family protein [Armatimonadota bacterium]MDR7550453.1 DinB family protein [Armatimonadota bacterium]